MNLSDENIGYPYKLFPGCKRGCYFYSENNNPNSETKLFHTLTCPNRKKSLEELLKTLDSH